METKKYARVTWQYTDIQQYKPDWTKERCEKFLHANEKCIEELTVQAGWDIIRDLLTINEE
jgi:hypothetical protein